MTILTKCSLEKKPLPGAMVPNDTSLPIGLLLHPHTRGSFSDQDTESMIFNRPQFTWIKTIILFLISLIVMMMGVLGGYTLYRMFAPPQTNMHYHALCDIPYDNLSAPRLHTGYSDSDIDFARFFHRSHDFELLGPKYFREEIELDSSDDENYSRINVPDFKDGRRGRFMHDFKVNQSAIIDTTANRCFIMTLDRDTTMPPKDLIDFLLKMKSGYYNIDTEHIRRTMRVVTPPITDLSLISERIATECFDMKVYMLENYVSGVSKREAKILTDSGKFAQFSGKGIVEFDIINIQDIENYEKNQK